MYVQYICIYVCKYCMYCICMYSIVQKFETLKHLSVYLSNVLCVHLYMYVCMCVHLYVCMWACTNVCKYACVSICMYVCMHECIYACSTWTAPRSLSRADWGWGYAVPASPLAPPAAGCPAPAGRACSSPARCAPGSHTAAWPVGEAAQEVCRTSCPGEWLCPQTRGRRRTEVWEEGREPPVKRLSFRHYRKHIFKKRKRNCYSCKLN